MSSKMRDLIELKETVLIEYFLLLLFYYCRKSCDNMGQFTVSPERQIVYNL